MTTRNDLRTLLEQRTTDTANAVWSQTEWDGFLDTAIDGLYPTWFKTMTGTTTAGAGPIQTMPSGAQDLYYVGVQTPTSNRVRVMRGWQEGNGDAVIPKVGIAGYTLVWAWTAPYTKPANGSATLSIPSELEEVVILRAHIAALENLLTDRVKKQAYLSVTVREGASEQEIMLLLNALHDSLDERVAKALPRPERVG